MGNFISCCKINENEEIDIDDTKLHVDDNKLKNSNFKKFKKDFRTSVGPPVIVGRTVVDEEDTGREDGRVADPRQQL